MLPLYSYITTEPGTHWLEGWMGPGADLDTVEKREYLPIPGIESQFPRLSSPYLVPILTELFWLQLSSVCETA
jgi:hypothetical protein